MIKYLSNTEFKAKASADNTLKAPLLKATSRTSTPLEGRQIKFILSAPEVDRDFDLISINGIDLSSYRTNPVVLLNHDRRSLPVGKCVSIGIEGGCLVGVVEFVDADIPFIGPQAEAVYQLCKTGVLNAVSIGFETKQWTFATEAERRENGGTDIQACELHEFSIVTIPSNRGALIQELAAEPEQEVQEAPSESADKSAPEGDARLRRHRKLKRIAALLR